MVLVKAWIGMQQQMNGMVKSGNEDKDFLNKMIPHHQSAVVMSREEIAKGKNEELKLMAKKIMNDQNREIQQFQALLAKMK